MESKVREATNDEAWGPTGQLMQELAQATFSYEYFPEVMGMLWRRMLVDNQSNWRRTYKSLVVLNYLVKNGAERVVTSAREHIYDLKSLENYSCVDETGKDNGQNVRLRVKQLMEFIQDDDALREERKKAKKNRDKYIGVSSDGAASLNCGLRYNRSFSDSVRGFEDKPKENPKKMSSGTKTKVSDANNDASVVSDSKDMGVKDAVSNSSKNLQSVTSTGKPAHVSVDASLVSTEDEVDLFGGFDPVVSDNSRPKSSPSVANATGQSTSANNDELKEIVKNIDIFSSKRPRPQRTNKSSIPDLTLNNPNPPSIVNGGVRRTNQSPHASITKSNDFVHSPTQTVKLSQTIQKKKPENSFLLNEEPKMSNVTVVGLDDTTSTGPARVSSNPLDEFDLLSIGSVPSQVVDHSKINAESNSIIELGKPVNDGDHKNAARQSINIMDDISSLGDLVSGAGGPSDELFTLNQEPVTKQISVMDNFDQEVSGLISPVEPIPFSDLGKASDTSAPLTPEPAASKNPSTKSKLPDTWNNLVSGTNFNIDLDNLLRPDIKKPNAPTLNQLAQSKRAPVSNEDLFG